MCWRDISEVSSFVKKYGMWRKEKWKMRFLVHLMRKWWSTKVQGQVKEMSVLKVHIWLKSQSMSFIGRKPEPSRKEQQDREMPKHEEGTASRTRWTRYLEVELFGCSTKSLQDIQCRVAPIHVLRTEVTLNKFMCLLLNPTFNFFSARRKTEILKS